MSENDFECLANTGVNAHGTILQKRIKIVWHSDTACLPPRSVDLHGDGSLQDRQQLPRQLSAETEALNCEEDCLAKVNHPDSCGR